MRVTNDLVYNAHPVNGTSQPEIFWGTDRPGTGSTFTGKNVGTIYICKPATGIVETWQRVLDADDSIHDWRCVHGVLQETVTRASMTDGGSTAGTKVLTADLPAGAQVQGSNITDITGFIGDTSAVATIGDGSDADRYQTSTTNVFTTGSYPASDDHDGKPSGVAGHSAEMATITVTVTSAADFTNVSAGSLTVTIFYVI